MSESLPAGIATAQNTERAQRLLATQARLYTDAKQLHDLRVLTVVGLAVITVIVALAAPEARSVVGSIGGSVALLWSLLGGGREKRSRKRASLVQEEFDTQVFAMPWAVMADHPSPSLIASAASRYRGNRTKDWYADTVPVARPLDILICQRSNLGWGAAMHQLYAAVLAGFLLALVLAGLAVALIADLRASDIVTVLVVPLLGPTREVFDMFRNNCDSGDAKAKAESKVQALWERALRSGSGVTLEDCRAVQDHVVSIRQTNAHVLDWLDNLRRTRSEGVMQQSVAHLVEEAVQHGKTR